MKKIETGIHKLDEIQKMGIPVGNTNFFIGKSKTENLFVRFIPVALEQCCHVMFNLEQHEAITEFGQCIMDEMLKRMKKEGFDIPEIKRGKTINEKIGDTWFPVTYYDDGMVTVDYPSRLLSDK